MPSRKSKKSPRALPNPQVHSYLLSKVPKEVRFMIWEYVFAGNDLYVYSTKPPVLLERLEPGKRKLHWFPLRSAFLGVSPRDGGSGGKDMHAWKVAKSLMGGGDGHSIMSVLLTCKIIYEEASLFKHHIHHSNHLFFLGTLGLEQLCRTIPTHRLLTNTWSVFPDSQLSDFLAQIPSSDSVTNALTLRTFTHPLRDELNSFIVSPWGQIQYRIARHNRIALALDLIKRYPDAPFPEEREARVVLAMRKGYEDVGMLKRRKDVGICFQIDPHGD